jgi:D-sedoheptulose 7-phosphate isomerase
LTAHFVKHSLKCGLEVRKSTVEYLADSIMQSFLLMMQVLESGGSLYIMGNGGSAAMSQHFASEITGLNASNNFETSFSVMSLTSDTAVLTGIANDFGYLNVFSCQINAFVSSGDLVIGLSTSGRSENILKGFESAKLCGAKSIALTGRSGLSRPVIDTVICIDSEDTTLVQEEHLAILHVWLKCMKKYSKCEMAAL